MEVDPCAVPIRTRRSRAEPKTQQNMVNAAPGRLKRQAFRTGTDTW